MTIFDVLTLIGGLCLFLFGMNLMGESLERRAGSKLRDLLGKLTTNKAAGFLTGLGVTAVIQSSSATTVMVVGFVNSGLMTLSQAINVIMGANVGTTVTAWILSLGGIESSNVFVQLLKPTSFTPVLALIGTVLYMFGKSSKSKDTGTILLGFATLMFGMDTMSGAVSGLKEVEEFRNILLLFKNPILGVLAGAVLTAIIQSSSASVGILQALSSTGAVTMHAAIPIIMGQNIGTCVTALLSSIGANKNAKRASLVHLSFNVIGTVVWLTVFSIVTALVHIPLLDNAASEMSIAVAHSTFNILCTLLLLPMTKLLEKLAYKLIPEVKAAEEKSEMLDERLFATPHIALERASELTTEMAECASSALKVAMNNFTKCTPEIVSFVKEGEDKTDHYEDILGTYLVKLSGLLSGEDDSAEATKLLRVIGDFERISDHGMEIIGAAEELNAKNLSLTSAAEKELTVLFDAVTEVVDLTFLAFSENNLEAAAKVEPLEQVVDGLKEQLRQNHIARLQHGECTIEAGFIWTDLLTALKRTSDHCSNVAACVLDTAEGKGNLNLHEFLRDIKENDEYFKKEYAAYQKKYAVASVK
ncbi:MAG: Na/Pi cotransporter family protein [Clostridia bacterium]|nr:Na/Pi cotransporter family protein [Clostridia bacterium]